MWLRQQSQDLLEAWLRHSPSQYLASDANGTIFWANNAFLEWSKYSASELKTLTWMKLSVDDEHLQADLAALQEVLDGYTQIYSCQKKYQPKNERPVWGNFTGMRYPPTGPIECFLCHWEPLKNGTAAAFNLAMDRTQDGINAMKQLTLQVEQLTRHDEDEDFIIRAIRAARRHPKFATFILTCIVGMPAANQLRELAMWLLGITPVVESVQPVRETPTATKIAHMPARDPEADMILTGSGLQIEWHREQGVQPLWPTTHYQ
jgi:PAS domain S-box-containing protein